MTYIHASVHLSIYLFIYPSICGYASFLFSIYFSIYLSIYAYTKNTHIIYMHTSRQESIVWVCEALQKIYTLPSQFNLLGALTMSRNMVLIAQDMRLATSEINGKTDFGTSLIDTYIHTQTHAYIHTYTDAYVYNIQTYVHRYVHRYIRTYIHRCIHTGACMHACMHAYIHAYERERERERALLGTISIYIHAYIQGSSSSTCLKQSPLASKPFAPSRRLAACTGVYVYMYTYMYIYTCIYTHTYMHTYIYAYVLYTCMICIY
jgi:hypothetical protein